MTGESADTVPGLSPRRCGGCRALLTSARACPRCGTSPLCLDCRRPVEPTTAPGPAPRRCRRCAADIVRALTPTAGGSL